MSTFEGQSGRHYPLGQLLRRHPKNPEYDIYKTQYVPNPVANPHGYEQCTHEPWVVSMANLSSQLSDHPDLPKPARKKILRLTSEAMKELHGKDWIHIGTALSIPELVLKDRAECGC